MARFTTTTCRSVPGTRSSVKGDRVPVVLTEVQRTISRHDSPPRAGPSVIDLDSAWLPAFQETIVTFIEQST